jgi:hypothetical protein
MSTQPTGLQTYTLNWETTSSPPERGEIVTCILTSRFALGSRAKEYSDNVHAHRGSLAVAVVRLTTPRRDAHLVALTGPVPDVTALSRLVTGGRPHSFTAPQLHALALARVRAGIGADRFAIAHSMTLRGPGGQDTLLPDGTITPRQQAA